MTSIEKLGLGIFLSAVALAFTVAIGWILNIVELVQHTGDITGLFVARVAGVFIPPLGAILGYFF